MAPRSGKKKFRARNPIPVWLPLPRPCLRSLNMPGHPYYMPISPEMYLPPWTLPPSYYPKPMCHCANENFCTTSNCRNSAECLKMHPMFCPYGTDHEETSDLQRNVTEQQKNRDNQETSSNSDTNVCSACGAPSSKPRTSGKKYNIQDNQSKPHHTSKVIRSQDSSHNVKQCYQDPSDIGSERLTDSGHTSPEILLSKNPNGCVNSSCQTTFSDSRTRGNNRLIPQKKYNLNSPNRCKRSLGYTTDAVDSETFHDRNVSIRADVNRAPANGTKNEFGCKSFAEQQNGSANDLDKHNAKSMSNDMQELIEIPKEMTTDSIHMDQLPENISTARKKQASKNSRCCNTGSEKNCKTDIEIDNISKPNIEIPYNNITKSRKKSDCGCYTSNTTSKSHKLTDCLCSSNTPFQESSRFRKKSKCECSPHNIPQKYSSRTHKLSECACSAIKITQKKHPRKVSEYSGPSSNIPHKVLSHSRKLSENGFSSTEGNIPKVSSSKLTTKKSNKSLKDIASVSETNVKQSNCQCRFPPAYEHLSCTGNENNSCSCKNKA